MVGNKIYFHLFNESLSIAHIIRVKVKMIYK